MEADWEFEIAPDAPVIDAAWAGFVDLRRQPERVSEIEEAVRLPALGPVLLCLNGDGSPVFTAKCDVWDAGSVDADELDASPDTAAHALACYIDVLPVDVRAWPTAEAAAEWARSLCASLKGERLGQCRVDLVIRSAYFAPTEKGIGITCYAAGCGATESEAAERLSRALRAFSVRIK